MQRFHLSCAILLAFACVPAARADDSEGATSPTFDIERFYRDVRQLARRHYPDASAHRLGNKIHFEHNTRIFIVHEPLKTGAWQDPWEERGPRMGGVHCDIEYRSGLYGGQAAVPQTTNKRYFQLHLLAPYAKRFDGHLYVHLKLPGNSKPPQGFEQAFTTLINGFEAYAAPE